MNTMRTIKQLAVTAGLLAMCGLPSLVHAQEAPQGDPQGNMQGQQAAPPQQKHENEMANLNLSDDQKAQVKKIHEDLRTQAEAVKNDTTMTADQKRAKMHELHKAAHEQTMQVLTPEQRKQAKADEMERKASKQQGSQTPPPQQ
jgi:Spy/CpxP family protein refolding chaperone